MLVVFPVYQVDLHASSVNLRMHLKQFGNALSGSHSTLSTGTEDTLQRARREIIAAGFPYFQYQAILKSTCPIRIAYNYTSKPTQNDTQSKQFTGKQMDH